MKDEPRPQRYCRGYEIKTANLCEKVSTSSKLRRSKIYNFTKVSNGSRLEDKIGIVQRVYLYSPEIKVS